MVLIQELKWKLRAIKMIPQCITMSSVKDIPKTIAGVKNALEMFIKTINKGLFKDICKNKCCHCDAEHPAN